MSKAVASVLSSTLSRFVPEKRPISTKNLIHNNHSNQQSSSNKDDCSSVTSEGGHSSSVARGGVVTPFPWKVHDMLEKGHIDGIEHLVCWLPHGRAFMVHQPEEFVVEVMVRTNFLCTRSFCRSFHVLILSLPPHNNSPCGFHKRSLPHFNANLIYMAFDVWQQEKTRALTFTNTFFVAIATVFNKWAVKRSRAPRYDELYCMDWNQTFGACLLCRLQRAFTLLSCRPTLRRQRHAMHWTAVLLRQLSQLRSLHKKRVSTFSFLKESHFTT